MTPWLISSEDRKWSVASKFQAQTAFLRPKAAMGIHEPLT
jgi:hypothetical protein